MRDTGHLTAATVQRYTLTILAGFIGPTTSIAAGLGTTLAINARLTELAADAITILNSEDTTDALLRVYASEVFVATHLAARQCLLTTLLIVDAGFVFLTTDARAHLVRRLAANAAFTHLARLATHSFANNLIRWTAGDAIFADLALIAADVVANVTILRTAGASGIDAGIGGLAATLSGTRDQTFRATNS